MKTKIIALLFVAFAGFAGEAMAQISDRLMMHTGAYYVVVRQKQIENIPITPGDPQEFRFDFFTLNFGAYYLLMHKNDVFGLGVDPNINFGFRLIQGYVDLFVQTPVYLVGRIGAGATPYNEQKIGLGIGIGGTFTYYTSRINPFPSKAQATFLNPAAMVELNFAPRGGGFSLRGHMTLADVRATETYQGSTTRPDQQFNFGNFGLGLIYTF